MRCFENGALGLSQTLKFRQADLTYDPEIIETETIDLEVYFPAPPSPEFLHDLQSEFASVNFEFSEQQSRDWLEEWKKGFVAFPLIDDIWIVPSWLATPKEARQSLSIDPGLAFGTGTHETTQLAAAAVKELMTSRSIETVLDVGTGTGILALLAEVLGAAQVHATEIDPMAREVAVENVERNRARRIEVLSRQVEELSNRYDLVVANIIDGVLLNLAGALKARVKPGGFLLLTGILAERSGDFLKNFIAGDAFVKVRESHKGEWTAYVLRCEA